MVDKSFPVSFRLPMPVKVAMERAAADEDRSVSSWLERLVKARLSESGHLPAKGDDQQS